MRIYLYKLNSSYNGDFITGDLIIICFICTIKLTDLPGCLLHGVFYIHTLKLKLPFFLFLAEMQAFITYCSLYQNWFIMKINSFGGTKVLLNCGLYFESLAACK